MEREIDVVPGRVCGVREWRLHRDGGLLGWVSFLWADGGRYTVARCAERDRNQAWRESHASAHAPPGPHCSCGLYSLHAEPQTVLDFASRRHDPHALRVSGVIEVSGRLEVHADGMRAERARPIALFLPEGLSVEARGRIALAASRYQAQLLTVREYGLDGLLDWCAEHAPPLDRSFVDELVRQAREESEAAPRHHLDEMRPAFRSARTGSDAEPADLLSGLLGFLGSVIFYVLVVPYVIYGLWLAGSAVYRWLSGIG